MPHADEHDRLSELFARLEDASPAERPGLLREVCRGDTSLEMELRALLESEPPARFLDAPALGEVPEDGGPPPDRIGPYGIVRQIGAGGMGIVYEARQRNPDRRVALKILRPGAASPPAAEAVRIREASVGATHLSTLVSRSRRARIDLDHGRPDRAAVEFEAIEQAAATNGIDHWERAGWLLDYARCERRRGLDAEADRLIARARTMLEPLPDAHPLVDRARGVDIGIGSD
jgi:hypothetical protein